jgi:hypothetical protein
VQDSDNLRRRCPTREHQLLLNNHLFPQWHGEENPKERGSETPPNEGFPTENERFSAVVEFGGELGEGGDDAYETGGEGEGAGGDGGGLEDDVFVDGWKRGEKGGEERLIRVASGGNGQR